MTTEYYEPELVEHCNIDKKILKKQKNSLKILKLFDTTFMNKVEVVTASLRSPGLGYFPFVTRNPHQIRESEEIMTGERKVMIR